MPLSEMGSSPALLGTAGQLGLGMQEKGIEEQKITEQAIEQAGKLPAAAAEAVLSKKINQITITPELAKGLKSMTGQDWDASVGTKWDPAVFTPMVGGMTQAKYHADLLSNRDLLEKMREEAAQKRVETQQAGATERKGIATPKSPTPPKVTSAKDWLGQANSASKALISQFKGKGGVPSMGLIDEFRGMIGRPDKKKQAQFAALKQQAQVYRTAWNNYQAAAKTEGLPPEVEDPETAQAIDALLSVDSQNKNENTQPNATITKLPGLE